MKQTYVRKHVNLTPVTMDIVDDLINSNVGVKNLSEAVRYALLSLGDKDEGKNGFEKKLNALSKNVDILLEMTAGGFEEGGVTAIKKAEETFIFMDAKKNVENKIQKQVTKNSNPKKRTVEKAEESEPKKSRFRL